MINPNRTINSMAASVTWDEMLEVGKRNAYAEIKKTYGIDIVDMLVEKNEMLLRISALEHWVQSYEDLVQQILENKK